MSDLLNRLIARSIGTMLPVSPRLRRAYESPQNPASSASVHENREGDAMRADRVSATSAVRQSSGAEPYRGPLRVDAVGVQTNAPGPRMQSNLPESTAPRARAGTVADLTASISASVLAVQQPPSAIQRAPVSAAPLAPAAAPVRAPQAITPAVAESASGRFDASGASEPIAANFSDGIDLRGAPVTPRTDDPGGTEPPIVLNPARADRDDNRADDGRGSDASPTIEVTIGRIEVRAAYDAERRPVTRQGQPRLTLEEYLRQRNRRER